MAVTVQQQERGIALQLSGTYDLVEVEVALRDAFQNVPRHWPLVVLDWRRSEQNHKPQELERLAELLARYTRVVWVRTRDVLRYGFARALMGHASAHGLMVQVDHEDP